MQNLLRVLKFIRGKLSVFCDIRQLENKTIFLCGKHNSKIIDRLGVVSLKLQSDHLFNYETLDFLTEI